MTTPSFARDRIALAVATRLRMDECPHGLPYRVTARETVPPWEPGECTCRPLCDACVMEAVRQEVDTLTAALAAARDGLAQFADAANWVQPPQLLGAYVWQCRSGDDPVKAARKAMGEG